MPSILYAQQGVSGKNSNSKLYNQPITLAFTATPRDKNAHNYLSPQDFTILIDGKIELPLLEISDTTQSIDFLFLLDSSGSARDVITQQSEAALTLFDYFRAQNPRIGVIGFDEQAREIVSLTTDRARVRQAFLTLKAKVSRTAIFTAAETALEVFAAQPNASETTSRRIVILISDGLDNASQTKPQPIIERARRENVTFYVVQFPLYAPRNGNLIARPPSRGVSELATRTGGKFFRVGTAADALNPRAEYNLQPVFRALAADLKATAYAQFMPPAVLRDGTPHRALLQLISAKRRAFIIRQLNTPFILQP